MWKKTKNILVASIIISSMTIMTGCGAELTAYVTGELSRAFEERQNANTQIIYDLKSGGFITESEANQYAESVNRAFKEFTELGKKEDADGNVNVQGKSISLLQYSSSYIWGRSEDDIKSKYPGSKSTDPAEVFLSNYLHADSPESFKYANVTDLEVSDNEPSHLKVAQKPIAVFSSKVAADINSKFDFEVYVLKPISSSSSETSNEIYLDGISRIVQGSLDSEGNIISYEMLNNYFMPAIDENGKIVKLVDMNKEENQIVRITKDNGSFTSNKCGNDMVIRQAGLDQISVVLREFSKDGYDHLTEIVGENNRRYLLGKAGTAGANRAYLVEYPVEVVDTISDVDDSYAEIKTKISGMGVNLKTNEIIKYDAVFQSAVEIDESTRTVKGQPVSMEDNYYQMGGAKSETDTAKASFIVTGVGSANVGEEGIEVECGKVILRDYLEGTYIPEAVDKEPVVVLGRKMRIENIRSNISYYDINTRLSGAKKISTLENYALNGIFLKKSDIFARFYDMKGELVQDSPEIFLSDIADIYSLNNFVTEQRINYYIRPAGEKEAHGEIYDPLAVKNNSGNLDNSLNKSVGIGTVKKAQADKIKPCVSFPGNTIGEVDAHNNMNNDMPFYYTITLGADIYKNALYSDWIASSSSTASLNWWSDYLSGKNFIYNVNANSVLAAITGVYTYETDDSGKIIINLDDVSHVQEEIRVKKMADMVDGARTIFIILGYTMIGLAVILILLWVLDTSTDLGLGLLEKVTFGNWVAVKHEEDVPEVDTEGRSYLTFGKIIIRCSIIITVGLIFILAPVYQIILSLIKSVGGIAKTISGFISGVPD